MQIEFGPNLRTQALKVANILVGNKPRISAVFMAHKTITGYDIFCTLAVCSEDCPESANFPR